MIGEARRKCLFTDEFAANLDEGNKTLLLPADWLRAKARASTCKTLSSFRMHIDAPRFVLAAPLIQSTARLESPQE